MLTKQSFLRSELKPSYMDSRKNFELQAINLWTLDELYSFIDRYPEEDKIESIERFVKLMDKYACMARSNMTKMMYSASKAYAEYILDCHISEFAIN